MGNKRRTGATEEGALIIGVLDKDPETARNMVNVMLQELEIMNHHLATQKGKFNRQFLEERLKHNREDLAKSEESLRQFQKRYGAVEIPGQVAGGDRSLFPAICSESGNGGSVEAFSVHVASQ